jgi:dienelactone hydrolase
VEHSPPLVDAALRDLFFDYDRGLPLQPVERDLGVRDGVRVLHFTISSTHGERVPGLLWTPEGAAARLPLLLVQHGAGTKKEDDYISLTAQRWARDGFAVAAIDAHGHGERQRGEQELAWLWELPWLSRDHAIQMCVDLQRTLDYLATRPEPDLARSGFVGFSMGANNGVAFVARDPRVRAAVFLIGGARLIELQDAPAAVAQRPGFAARRADHALAAAIVDASHFAAQIAPRPVLMINGRRDEIVSPAAAQALFDALGEPKRIIWFDGGHTDIRGEHLKAAEAFLRERL